MAHRQLHSPALEALKNQSCLRDHCTNPMASKPLEPVHRHILRAGLRPVLSARTAPETAAWRNGLAIWPGVDCRICYDSRTGSGAGRIDPPTAWRLRARCVNLSTVPRHFDAEGTETAIQQRMTLHFGRGRDGLYSIRLRQLNIVIGAVLRHPQLHAGRHITDNCEKHKIPCLSSSLSFLNSTEVCDLSLTHVSLVGVIRGSYMPAADSRTQRASAWAWRRGRLGGPHSAQPLAPV